MHNQQSTHIGISDEHRKAISFSLNQLLADEHVLYIKTRNYHWNVQGLHFRTLHSLFEELYEQLEKQIDEIAERVRSLGHFAVGSLGQYTKLARLLETDHTDGDGLKMVQSLLKDHETIIRFLRKDLEEDANQLRDAGTSDLLTSIMEKHEKTAWILRSIVS
jgi:starvation-inducible DNA-binding protein